jgi:serine/threonine protein kinase
LLHSKKANQRSEKQADESKYGQELLQRAGGAAAMLLISQPSRVLANDRSVWRTVIYSGNNYMKCSICGNEVSGSAGLCPSCGSSVDIGTGPTLEPEAPPHGGGSTGLLHGPAAQKRSSSPSGGISTPSGYEAHYVPGTILADRYRIVSPLGKGGMGEVYRAEDLKLGQTVALKFLPRSLARTDQALERFAREVRLARQVSHPNVCRVFDLGEISEVGEAGKKTELTFLTMEFVDGEDLASLMRRIGRLPSDKALEIAQQLCAGLAAAHESGIVHRDLKPANIMLDGRGRVRITDFGLAGLIAEIEGANARAGTPAYMSPEQFAGHGASPKSDVYSLGLVLYEIFTGKRPFNASSIEEMARLRDKNAPPAPSHYVKGLDPRIERVILRCLERDSGKRPASALQVAATLPGGDPLAAAIAAGETPSPDTVAASGESVSMSKATSLALLAAVLLGITTSAFLARYATVLGSIHGGKSPEVLTERAREVIAHSGYNGSVADSAWWFDANREDLPNISRGSPDGMHFIYRQSPRPMIPQNQFTLIDRNDPAADVPGMVTVVLDAAGRLREFSEVPIPAEKQGQVLDWSVLLSEAGVGVAQLAEQDAKVLPPTAFDARQDWQSSDAGRTLNITAAAYKGKPVYFRAAPIVEKSGQTSDGTRTFSDIMFVFAVLVCGIGGCFLARRNVRRGRGDRQGAFRVAAFIFVAELLGWALSAHFFPNAGEEYGAFIGGCGEALYVAGFMWVLYLAVEPYVRRRWPEMLISWTRVLSGHLHDSRVGRDILLGGLGGAAMAIIQNGLNALPYWFPVTQILPIAPSQLVLGAPASMLAALGVQSSLAVQWALATVSFLLVARVIMRRDWLAVMVSAVCLGMVVLAADNLVLAVTAALLCSVVVYGLLFRFGLLSVAVALFFYFVLRRWPLTLDVSQWFVWRSVFAMSLLVAISVYAFQTINVGRSFFAESDLD